MTAGRLVYARAAFTAFSTASAPLLDSSVFFAKAPGVTSLSSSHTRTYDS